MPSLSIVSQSQSARAKNRAMSISFPEEGIAKVELECLGRNGAESKSALERLLGYLSEDSQIRMIIISAGNDFVPAIDTNTEASQWEPNSEIIVPLKYKKREFRQNNFK
jgi:hypothetical protein